MICGHCQKPISAEWRTAKIIETELFHTMGKALVYIKCPGCGEVIVGIQNGSLKRYDKKLSLEQVYNTAIIYPKTGLKIPLVYLPHHVGIDYEQAKQILRTSPQAAAVIMRKILQSVLRDSYHIRKYSLEQEIKVFKQLPKIPAYLAEALEAIRFIGNFAAHPSKDTQTGEVISVDEEEAEWLMELLESLLNFTFIQPRKLEKRIAALNKKLKKMGKPSMNSKID